MKPEDDRKVFVHQEQPGSLMLELSRSEERKRCMIASVLHEQVGQTLAMADRKLAALGKTLAWANLAGPVEEIRVLVSHALSHSRMLISELSKPIHSEPVFDAVARLPAAENREEHNQQEK